MKTSSAFGLAALLLTLTTAPTQAQVPLTLSYQGVLSDTDGNAVPDGNYALTFTLYDADTGGQALWSEAQTVEITKGLFQVILGSVAPLNVPFDAPYWLGVQVDQEAEMVPRVALTASAYSLSSRAMVSEAVPGASFTVRDAEGVAVHVLSPDGDVLHTGVGRFEGGVVVGDTTGVAGKRDDPPEIGIGSFGTSIGVVGRSHSGTGVIGSASSSGVGVHGKGSENTGVLGSSLFGTGVIGVSESLAGNNAPGVHGSSPWVGVIGFSNGGTGVMGSTIGDGGIGVHGDGGFDDLGGFFQGDPAGRFEGTLEIMNETREPGRTSKLRIEVLEEDPEEEKFLVWSDDQFVRYRTLPTGSGGDSGWTLDTPTNTVSTNHTVSVTHPTRGFKHVVDPEEGTVQMTDRFGQSVVEIGERALKVTDFTGAIVAEITFAGEAFFESLTAQNKNFRIDHPLDPEGKYLQHVSVESPDMKTFYDGTVVLDAAGEAWIELPAYFEALNGDFRYQLTAVGAPGPNLYIAEKITDNRFKIAGGRSAMEVSWQVTGIRHDAYAEQHRVPVELDKPSQQ